MSIEINGIELAYVHRVVSHEGGGHVLHAIPGHAGDLSQDMGRSSLQVQIDGIFYGPEAGKNLKALREVHLKRKPVEFLAQLTGQAYAAKVIISTLQVMDASGQPDQYSYQMTVVEYIEPPANALSDMAGVDAVAALEAAAITDLMELPDMLALGSIPELSNPIEPLKGVLTPVQEASSSFIEAAQGLKSLLGNSSS